MLRLERGCVSNRGSHIPPEDLKARFQGEGCGYIRQGENPALLQHRLRTAWTLTQGVLRRLGNIVVAPRLRKTLPLPTPYFLRSRRRKQLSTVSYSLTRRFDQNYTQKLLH